MFAFLLRSGCVRRTSFVSRNAFYLFDDTKFLSISTPIEKDTRAERTGRVEVVAHDVIAERKRARRPAPKVLWN
jgi:hypothetical protein